MSQPQAGASPAKKQGANLMKTRHLTMMGLGSAVGAGLFLGVGLGIQISGTSVLLSYIVAGILVTLIMRMLGEMAAARPSLGSFSTFSGMAFGNWARFTNGWIYWFMLVMVMGAEITGASAIIGAWFGIAPVIPALVVVVLFALVNFANVRGFGEFEFWFAIIKIVVIIGFIGIGVLLIFGLWPNATGANPGEFIENFAPNGLSGIAAGLLAVAFAFGGIELVTIAAAESEDPAKNVKTAVNAIIFRILFFYIGSVLVITLLLPFDSIQDADVAADSPFTQILSMANIPGAAGFMELIIVIALLSAFNAQIYATSRLVFNMSRDGNAPAVFSKVNKASAPQNAVVLSVIFAFGSVALQWWNPPGLLEFLFNAVGGCLLVIWILTILSYLKLHPVMKRNGELGELNAGFYPWDAYISLAALAGIMILMLTDPGARGQLLAVAVLLSGLLVISIFVGQNRKRKGLSNVVKQ